MDLGTEFRENRAALVKAKEEVNRINRECNAILAILRKKVRIDGVKTFVNLEDRHKDVINISWLCESDRDTERIRADLISCGFTVITDMSQNGVCRFRVTVEATQAVHENIRRVSIG